MPVRFLSALVCLALITTTAASARQAQTLGVAPSLKTATPIKDVIAKPADFEGKTVRLEGVVSAVCTEMGCWMALASPDDPTGPTVRFKVEDGVIVFPLSAKGKRATAQGVVERVTSTEGQEALMTAMHPSPEHAAAPAPAVQWQVKATGAIIF